MSSPWKKQPEDVVDSILKRAEVSKVSTLAARRVSGIQIPMPLCISCGYFVLRH